MNTVTNTSGNRLYGSNATRNALNVPKAFRVAMNNTANRGPRPGLEVKAHNAWLLNHGESK